MEKHIYAINRSQVFYTFKVIGETENEFVVKDIETTSYELSQVKFYLNKKNLCDARCEEKTWEFIVKEDFFASFNLEDVKKEFNKRQIELILNNIKVYEEKIKELENKVILQNKEYNIFNSLNDFEIGDTMYILCDKKLYEANVVSFVTTDKINFTPNIQCENVGIEDYFKLQVDNNNNLYIDCWEKDYDYCDCERYQVFLTKLDYENYKYNKENESNIKLLNEYKQMIIRNKNSLKRLGYEIE
jgi:exonuclease VII small subunit